jgi:hypothetical protein
VPNELICAEIGRFLCLPVSPEGIIHAPNVTPEDWFASLDFNLTGTALPPVDTAACVASLPDPSAGLLLFDILIANCDRHRGSFAVDLLAHADAGPRRRYCTEQGEARKTNRPSRRGERREGRRASHERRGGRSACRVSG